MAVSASIESISLSVFSYLKDSPSFRAPLYPEGGSFWLQLVRYDIVTSCVIATLDIYDNICFSMLQLSFYETICLSMLQLSFYETIVVLEEQLPRLLASIFHYANL